MTRHNDPDWILTPEDSGRCAGDSTRTANRYVYTLFTHSYDRPKPLYFFFFSCTPASGKQIYARLYNQLAFTSLQKQLVSTFVFARASFVGNLNNIFHSVTIYLNENWWFWWIQHAVMRLLSLQAHYRYLKYFPFAWYSIQYNYLSLFLIILNYGIF